MNDAGIRAALQEGRDLTPTERQLATAVLRLGVHVQDLSIKQLAKAASCSVSTVHRLCHKVGLEGHKSLPSGTRPPSSSERLRQRGATPAWTSTSP